MDMTSSMTSSETDSRTLRILDAAALRALPSETSPHGIVKHPVLRRGQDVVAMRASLPPNADIPPHGHPKGKAAMLFVLAGELQLGLGTQFDPAALRRVAPGGMAVFQADDPLHFARTGPEGAEFLVIAAPPEAVMPAMLGAAP